MKKPLHYVFIESNTTGTGQIALERLCSEGHRVSFLTRQLSKYPFLSAISGVEIVETETNDQEQLMNTLEKISQCSRPHALLTFSTYYVPTVAVLAAKLGLPYLNPTTARICHEKDVMRYTLKAAGFPTPRFWRVASEEEACIAAQEVSYPCVVKPVSESGSLGVRLIQNQLDLLHHYRTLTVQPTNARGQSTSGAVLVEELLVGPEFSVETVTLDRTRTLIVGVTEKHLSETPYFVEIGHDFPAAVDEDIRKSLEDAVLEALRIVGYDYGPAHTEIRWTTRGPIIVEINPRIAGGLIPELICYAFGIDMIAEVLDMAIGREPRLDRSQDDYASIRFFTTKKSGLVKKFHSLDWARELSLVRVLAIERTTGLVRRPESSSDRLGYVITSGNDRDSVIAIANNIMRHVTIDVVSQNGTVSRETLHPKPNSVHDECN